MYKIAFEVLLFFFSYLVPFLLLIWKCFLFSVLNLLIYFNWRIITLPILWWPLPYINMNRPQAYMCPLPPEPPSHLPPPPILPGIHRAPALGSLCHTSNSHWPSILHMVIYICFKAILSNHPNLFFSHCVQKSVPSVRVSFAALHVGWLVLSF